MTDALASQGLFRDLAPDTIAAICRVARRLDLAAGKSFVREGEKSSTLYLVETGRVGVYRTAHDGDTEHALSELGPGDLIGEMALLDGQPRSTSARAETDCRLIEIRADDLLALPDGHRLVTDLRGNLGATVVQRMRRQNDEHVAAMEREIEGAREQQLFGQFFVYTLSIMAIGTLVNTVIAQHILHVNIYTQRFAWQYLMVLFVPSAIVIWRMGIPLRDIGITTVGLWRSLKEGVILAIAIMALLTAFGLTLKYFDILTGKPAPFDPYGLMTYCLHSLLQEVIARGFLQTSFQRFLGDEKGWRSVVLAAVLFGIFHLHFGMAAVVLVIISGLAFGAIYLRHRNLAGVTLVHIAAGIPAFTLGLL